MSKLKIEFQITVLIIIIGIVVVTIGYFSYKSLSQIVQSIQQGTRPDNKIYIIKDIASDLMALENTVRLYGLTKKYDELDIFYTLEDNIAQSFKKLSNLENQDEYEKAHIDSFLKLSQEKVDLWNDILTIHLSAKSIFPAFSKIYSNLDELKKDTVSVDTSGTRLVQADTDSAKTVADTVISEPSIETKTIRKKIQKLELEIYRNNKQKNVKESRLFERNVIIGERINQVISEVENREANDLLEKAAEADRLAEVTYRRLAVYTFSAVLLLLIALFVLFNYLKKSRATQRALADARKKAETLAHAKEQFAANVSHELRTPVNAIYGLTEQVLQKKLDNETSEMVSVIFKSADHLRNIVNDTLDFSKIQSGNIVFASEYFSPAEIFEEIYALVKHDASNKGVSLNIHWEGEIPEILIGDSLRLKQIMFNLVGNAIKFTERGEVTVIVKGVKHSDQNFELEIQVNDTGIGIDEKNLRIIFDEYVQIENHAGKKHSGTGLGLSIVKKLVELQGGKIKLESKPGAGTKVKLNIFYIIGEGTMVEKVKNAVTEIPELFKQLSILIADDEEYNRFLLKSILQKWGIHFLEAKNGNEVVRFACNEHFDVILMDINMPEMNGIEATKTILKCDADVKIIAVTAAADELDQQACFKAGMKGILIKPYSEKDLFDTIGALLREQMKENRSASFSQAIDISELRHLAGGDDKFMDEMIRLFIKSMETGISEIETAVNKDNLNVIAEVAHRMAAPVKHIGAKNLYENIKLLEKLAQQNVTVEAVSKVFQEIKDEIEEFNTTLKLYYHG